MFSKERPKVVKAKKQIFVIGAIIILLVIFYVIRNICNAKTPIISTPKEAIQNLQDSGNTKSLENFIQNSIEEAKNETPITKIDSPKETENSSDEALQKAMEAPISANQINITPDYFKQNQQSSSEITEPKDPLNPNSDQQEKIAFLKTNQKSPKNYLPNILEKPLSNLELKAGSTIPAILLTGMNSDLPGLVTGQIRENVFDTINGDKILIPQGAKVVGVYDSQISFGQKRILIVWQRIIMPNGNSLNLSGMPGVDLTGFSGFSDQINNHYAKIFSSVLLMSSIAAGAQLSQPKNDHYDSDNPTIAQTMAASLGTNIMDTTNSLVQKNLSVQPTLVIRPGYLFNIAVTKDIVFPSSY